MYELFERLLAYVVVKVGGGLVRHRVFWLTAMGSVRLTRCKS